MARQHYHIQETISRGMWAPRQETFAFKVDAEAFAADLVLDDDVVTRIIACRRCACQPKVEE